MWLQKWQWLDDNRLFLRDEDLQLLLRTQFLVLHGKLLIPILTAGERHVRRGVEFRATPNTH